MLLKAREAGLAPASLALALVLLTLACGGSDDGAFASGCFAFVSDRTGDPEVFTLNLATGETVQLTDSEGVDTNPDWSPDGHRIVFTSGRSGDFALYVMGADGSDVARVTAAGGYHGAAHFSRDGQQIVFDAEDAGGMLSIFVADAADASTPRQLTRDSDSGKPAWSPDGASIAYMRQTGGATDIYAVATDVSLRARLTEGPTREALPAWSPDGRKIAFASDLEGNWDIYLMDADGSNQRRLTDDPGEDLNPSWSPDGDTLAFTSDRNGNVEAYTMTADGRDLRDVTNSPAWDYVPQWSPTGRCSPQAP